MRLVAILSFFVLIGCNKSEPQINFNISGTEIAKPNTAFRSSTGTQTDEIRQVTTFEAIDFQALGVVNVVQDQAQEVKVSGDAALVSHLETVVENNTLKIRFKDETKINWNLFKDEPNLKIYVATPQLKGLYNNGGGLLRMEGLKTDALSIELGGGGVIELKDVTAASLETELGGAGKIFIAGQSKSANLEVSGAGKLDAENLICETVSAEVSGMGSIHTYATQKLRADVSGAGSIRYKGEPVVEKNISGLGRVSAE